MKRGREESSVTRALPARQRGRQDEEDEEEEEGEDARHKKRKRGRERKPNPHQGKLNCLPFPLIRWTRS